MRLVVRDPNIGDALLAFPAIEALYQQDYELEIVMENKAVQDLLYTTYRKRIVEGGEGIEIGAWAAVQKYGREIHPTQALMKLAGLEAPETVPKIDVYIRPGVWQAAQRYGILLAPWSKDPARGLTEAEVKDLVNLLMLEYPGESIAVLGGANDPSIDGVNIEYGQPLNVVVAMMKKAKTVITVDSACNRLAHAADIGTHVLLATPLTPDAWQGHPGVHYVRGSFGAWRIDAILRAIEEARSVAA